MKTGLSVFSRLEQLGIVLMVAGIGLGFYGRIVGPRMLSSASQRYASHRDTSNNMSEVKNLIQDITDDIVRGEKAIQMEGIGQWWFFSGLAVFVVSRRKRWNVSSGSEQTDWENAP